MLAQYADALSARLGCFDELEALGADFHTLTPSAGHAEVLPLLNRLDDCLNYMSSNPQYMDTMSYTLRLRQLQVRVPCPTCARQRCSELSCPVSAACPGLTCACAAAVHYA